MLPSRAGSDSAWRTEDVEPTLADTHAALPAVLISSSWVIITTVLTLAIGGWLLTRGAPLPSTPRCGSSTHDRRRRWSNRIVLDRRPGIRGRRQREQNLRTVGRTGRSRAGDQSTSRLRMRLRRSSSIPIAVRYPSNEPKCRSTDSHAASR